MSTKRKVRRRLNLKKSVLLLAIIAIAIPTIVGTCTLFSEVIDVLKGIVTAIFKFSYEFAYLIF